MNKNSSCWSWGDYLDSEWNSIGHDGCKSYQRKPREQRVPEPPKCREIPSDTNQQRGFPKRFHIRSQH